MATYSPVPIAIVGMSCRFPAGANNPEKLWEMLSKGQTGWTDVPADRYNWKSFYHPSPEASGAHNQRGGHFLDQDISEFDANFFGIPAAEAQSLDPQQRLQLETAYEALENAGIPLEKVRGSNTSVYVAVVSRDYDRMIYKDPSDIPKYHLTGCGDATVCGRLSYTFDFKGPAVTIDTGCSGSMVGLHQACQGLRLGESDMALVGGTNLLLGPDMTIAMSMIHMLNDDGRCYSFDNRGSGYGRSEGVASIILKRLDDALKAGDPIRGVIRNTGVNQDGRTNGILLPSLTSQESLMRSMYQSVGLDPLRDVDYIEAHGTGTVAGDATEINSIRNVFCDGDNRESPLYVGSIKANIGHLESSSGLAGIIKACLAIEKGLIPPVPNIQTLKENLQLEIHKIKIPQQLETWPTRGVRRASVNSFGFGGTNSHAILESAPGKAHIGKSIPNSIKKPNGIPNRGASINGYRDTEVDKLDLEHAKPASPQLYVFTAKSKTSVLAIIENIRKWASGRRVGREDYLQDLAYTLAIRRTVMSHRATLVASTHEEFVNSMSGLRVTKATPNFRVSFLFTGQGAQWFAMGRELLHTQTFGASLDKSEKILKRLGTSWSLLSELQQDESASRINQSEISQPATTAIQIALVDLMRYLSITPDAVLGHSSGEIAAAYAAGFLTQETAIEISYHRSFISSWCKEVIKQKGAMLAVGLGEDEVSAYLSQIQHGTAVIACANSPASTTISGDEVAIAELQYALDNSSVFNRKLKVDTAYHSHHMKCVAHRYLQSLEGIRASAPQSSVKFFSSVTGEEKLSDFGASYWVDNLVSKVRYGDALQRLVISQNSMSSSTQLFVELGPHAALQGPTRQSINHLNMDSLKHSYFPSMVRDRDAQRTILELTGKLFEQGYRVDLESANSLDKSMWSQSSNVINDLPPYSWDRNKYWHESRLSREYRLRPHPYHDLLGLRVVGSNLLEPIWRNILGVDAMPWLQEHIIDNFALFPGSGYLCMAIEAMRQIIQDRRITGVVNKFVLKEISFSKALVIPDSPAKVEVQLSLRSSSGPGDTNSTPWEEFCVTALSQDGRTWNEHCRGSIMVEFGSNPSDIEVFPDDGLAEIATRHEEKLAMISAQEQLKRMTNSCFQDLESASLYQELRENGIDYGSNFATIQRLCIGKCQAVGTVVIPDVASIMPSCFMQPHVIHPATFDALMHIVLPLYRRHCSPGPVMLTSIGEVTVSANVFNTPGRELLVACDLTPAGPRSGRVDVSVFQNMCQLEPVPVISLSHEEFRGIGEGRVADKDLNSLHKMTYHLDWTLSETAIHNTPRPLRPIIIPFDSASAFQTGFAGEIFSEFTAKGLLSSHLPWASIQGDDSHTYLIINDGSSPLLTCSSTHRFQEIVSLFKNADSILWISVKEDPSAAKSPDTAVVAGLARVARQENDNLKLIMLDVQSSIGDFSVFVDSVTGILEWFSPTKEQSVIENEFVYNQGKLYVPRLMPAKRFSRSGEQATMTAPFHQINRPLKLHVKTPGLLESLIFVDVEPILSPLAPHEMEIKVYAHAVNQNDVAVALGRKTSSMIGECAGIIVAMGSEAGTRFQLGDRVCGWGASTSYGSNIRVNHNLMNKLPSSLSFVEGASLSYAFETAYFALIEVAHLQRGQTVLIHSAAGGVAQAAIMIAQHIGAKIFATVSSASKRQLLIERFDIPEINISSSRSRTYKKAILRLTHGKGVNVVLNSGEVLQETWACTAKFGTLVNIGRSEGQLSLKEVAGNVTYATVDMALMAQHQPGKVGQLLGKVMSMFEAGHLQLIHPIVTMPMSEIADAFRLIQYRKHTGKVVLTADEATSVKQISADIPALKLDNYGTYIIATSGEDRIVGIICRFMISRGAKHIAILLPTRDSHQRETAFRGELRSMGANIDILLCDIDHRRQVESMIAGLKAKKHSIKGVVQTGSSSLNLKIDQMNVKDFECGVRAEAYGAQLLSDALASSPLDFFIMISSLSDILGIQGNGCHAVGGTFQAAFANGCANSNAHYMSLSLGPVEDPDIDDQRIEQGEILIERGCRPITIDDFFAILEYSMSNGAKEDHCSQLVVGFDRQSLSQRDASILANPIFNGLPQITESNPTDDSNPSKSIGKFISSAKGLDEVHDRISIALAEKISTLVALSLDDISLDMPVAELGLDSLIAIEFKNWIGRSLSALMQTSEILDASSLPALATLIATRSTLVNNELPATSQQDSSSQRGTSIQINGASKHETNSNGIQSPTPKSRDPSFRLPPHPLPDLDSTLQLYVTSIRSFCSDTELERTRAVVNDFLKEGGLGRRLQDRLVERYQDPNIDSWVSDLYNASGFLDRRVQLVPFSSFFFGHQQSKVQHTQAQRAALIAESAFKYKQLLDAGMIEAEYVNEQPVCMELHKWLFNAARKPCLGSDQMQKFPDNDYLVALRNGRVFKVMLREGQHNVPYTSLRITFDAILDFVDDEILWTGILTSDERNSWAKIRELIAKVNESNDKYLRVIEAAAFVICLDNASPSTPVERAKHFHFGDGSNRWNDKSIQFSICANGFSGFIGDHSLLDAATVKDLNGCINSAILNHKADMDYNGSNGEGKVSLEEFPFTTSPVIENHINHVRQQFTTNCSEVEHAFLTYNRFGGAFLREHKCAPKSAFQLIVLLAAQDHFGYLPPLWETVSVSNFHKGRIDINQIVLPPVADFCAVANNSSVPANIRRKLLFEAVKAHANSVTRASRGRGVDRHLSALRQVLHDDEPVPALFRDPIYAKTRPRKIMSHSHETGMLEKGFVLRDPEAIWVHHEIDDEDVRFSITGTYGNTQKFCDLLEKGAETIRALVALE